jgi:hypothetical protein
MQQKYNSQAYLHILKWLYYKDYVVKRKIMENGQDLWYQILVVRKMYHIVIISQLKVVLYVQEHLVERNVEYKLV